MVFFDTTAFPVPPAGSAVIILSSLDAFGLVSPWLEFLTRLDDANLSVAALCPYHPDRVSALIRDRIPVYQWSASLRADAIVDFVDQRRLHAL